LDSDLLFWQIARVAGLGAFASLSISILTGVAMRTAVLDWLAANRPLKSVHEFTAWLWIPLGAIHITALVLDRTAGIRLVDLLVPFLARYTGWGRIAVGLGTLAMELLVVVAVTGWLKRWIQTGLWQWLHRLSYVAFALIFLHAVLGGTDFGDPVVSALTWSVAFALAILSLARVAWGRLPASTES
jgi:predicted ferric reductase